MRVGCKRTFVDVDEQKQVCVFLCLHKDNSNVTNVPSPVVLNSFMLSGVRKWKQRYRLFLHVVCLPTKLPIFLFLVIYAFFNWKQIRFGKLATLQNVVKACAVEFLGIQEESYEEEIARRNIDIFLLDGRARVKKLTETFYFLPFLIYSHFFPLLSNSFVGKCFLSAK